MYCPAIGNPAGVGEKAMNSNTSVATDRPTRDFVLKGVPVEFFPGATAASAANALSFMV